MIENVEGETNKLGISHENRWREVHKLAIKGVFNIQFSHAVEFTQLCEQIFWNAYGVIPALRISQVKPSVREDLHESTERREMVDKFTNSSGPRLSGTC